METTIQKWGNSSAIRIPKMVLTSLNLSNSDTLDIEIKNNNIILKKAKEKKHIPLAERIKNYSSDYVTEEWETGTVGNEVL